jgi:hypothetical protein
MRQEVDIRYVVTSLKGSAQHLYEHEYRLANLGTVAIEGEHRDGLHCIGFSERPGSRGRTAPAAGCNQSRRKETTMTKRKGFPMGW